jgi:hypothetical protein
MTVIKQSTLTKTFFLIGVTAFFFILIQACARKITFHNSSVVPAAEGSVKIKKDNNNNYKIDLNVIRLADPKRLSPSKEVYLVWIDTENNGTKNIGQLKTSSGMFSQALKSSLNTVTPFKPIRIFITAEDNATVLYPGSQVVLNTAGF